MDDPATGSATLRQSFRCPGEAHPIDRGVHLARLAAFYPACLECAQRHDQTGLTTLQIAARAEVERHVTTPWQWTSEGLTVQHGSRLGDAALRRLAAALANVLWLAAPRERPTVLVGGGSDALADSLALFCNELERQGCLALEVGTTSSPCLATAVAHYQAKGALWIGRIGERPRESAVLVFGTGGRPASSPGLLDTIRQRDQSDPPRARRHGGGIERCDADVVYLPALAGAFHGLRPLTLVLETESRAVWRSWQKLSSETACRAISSAELGLARNTTASADKPSALADVAAGVAISGAHFGAWIDGAGECCRLVDERGRLVPAERLLDLLARRLAGGRVAPNERSREPLAAAALEGHAPLVGDTAGRIWFAGRAAPDGLAAVCLLLTLLSESDRTLSEVLDADAPGQ